MRSRMAMQVDVNAPAAKMLPPASSLAKHAENCSRLVWGIDGLRGAKLETLLGIFDPVNDKKRLCVQPTALGKTHIVRVMGTMLGGFHLIIHPILAFSADQVAAFMECDESYRTIEVHNFDEMSREQRGKFICHVRNLDKNSPTTIYEMGSPQLLALHEDFVETLIFCAKKGTLRSITVNEAHLYAQHGSSSRAQIRANQEKLFKRILNNNVRPIVLAMTATMGEIELKQLEGLLRTEFPMKCRTWASCDDFNQDQIEIKVKISSEYLRHLETVVDFVDTGNGEKHVCVFANSKKAIKYSEK